MVEAAGVRVPWDDLPASVRAGVEDVLGSTVVEAVTQPGGFSPGSADRVVTADGRRAFVKAVSTEANPLTPGMHRTEAAVLAALPAETGVPRLLGVHDDGTWAPWSSRTSTVATPACPGGPTSWKRCGRRTHGSRRDRCRTR